MKWGIYRKYHTSVCELYGVRNFGVLIRIGADKQNIEQNRWQIKSILEQRKLLSHRNFLVFCATTVFLNPFNNHFLYVSGSPHICAGFFDRNLHIIDGAHVSKGLKVARQKNNFTHGAFEVMGEDYKSEAWYQGGSSVERYFFEMANSITPSNYKYSNGRNANPIENAGGGFYILTLKKAPDIEQFKMNIANYKQAHLEYDRLNDSCVHSVLECLEIPIPYSYGLDTQTALKLIMDFYNLDSYIKGLDDPLELGEEESVRQKGRDEKCEIYKKYIAEYLKCSKFIAK